MPGRSPAEAVRAFLDPIQSALSCLPGQFKITPSRAHNVPGVVHSWQVNGERGIAFQDGLHFEPQMKFEIVPYESGWRVTTRAYRYKLARHGVEVFLMHWHPDGDSPQILPHMHLNLTGVERDTSKEHLTSPRMAIEDAIEWSIRLGQLEPARDDWETVLEGSRSKHIAYRSWHTTPQSTKPNAE